MEIVQEHTPDLSARDPHAAYYDPRDTGELPKWSLVHVEFRCKLERPVTLRDMKDRWGIRGGPLENMQMLRMARLSVSRVSEAEWRFLMRVADGEAGL